MPVPLARGRSLRPGADVRRRCAPDAGVRVLAWARGSQSACLRVCMFALHPHGRRYTRPAVAVDFSPYQAVFLDLDGTMYREEHALPGAAPLVARLIRQGQKFACLSNVSTSPRLIAARLARMGMPIDPAHIYTAAAATAAYVLERYGPHPRLYNLSSEGLQELLDGPTHWVQTAEEPCDAVLVGTPVSFYATEDRQRIGLMLLRRGAVLVGTSADRVYPSPRGLEFGAGALSAMLAYAANVQPVFCGKPQAVFFQKLCQRLGVQPGGCVLIGDNVESDVAGARAVGMQTILTLTGVTRREELATLPAAMRPDRVVDDLTQL